MSTWRCWPKIHACKNVNKTDIMTYTIISEICWEWKFLTAISSGSDVNQKFWVSTNLAEIAWHEHATMDVPLKRNR